MNFSESFFNELEKIAIQGSQKFYSGWIPRAAIKGASAFKRLGTGGVLPAAGQYVGTLGGFVGGKFLESQDPIQNRAPDVGGYFGRGLGSAAAVAAKKIGDRSMRAIAATRVNKLMSEPRETILGSNKPVGADTLENPSRLSRISNALKRGIRGISYFDRQLRRKLQPDPTLRGRSYRAHARIRGRPFMTLTDRLTRPERSQQMVGSLWDRA